MKKSRVIPFVCSWFMILSALATAAFGESRYFEEKTSASYLQFTTEADARTAIVAHAENQLFESIAKYLVDAGLAPAMIPDQSTYLGTVAGIIEPEIVALDVVEAEAGFIAAASVGAHLMEAGLKERVHGFVSDPIFFPNAVAGRVQTRELLDLMDSLEQELVVVGAAQGAAGLESHKKKIQYDSRSSLLRLRAVALNDGIIRLGETGLREKTDSVIAMAQKALEFDASNAWLYLILGRAHGLQQKYTQAEQDFTRAIRIDPYFSQAFHYRGVLYRHLGDLEEALEDFDVSISLEPQFEHSYVERGIAKRESGRLRSAILDFKKALKINPHNAKAFNEMGVAYHLKNENQAAMDAFNLALEKDPVFAPAYVNRGNFLLETGPKEEGCRDMRKACELGRCSELNRLVAGGTCISGDKTLAVYWSRKSFTYVSNGLWDQAVSAASVAISHDPGQNTPYINRSWAWAELGRFDEALKDCDSVIRIDPRSAQAYNNRGLVYQKTGNLEKAGQDYLRACSLGLETGCNNYLEVKKQ